ncbi:MAG: hypothetical protein V3R87_07465 [Dehalococcoidia bacterium]
MIRESKTIRRALKIAVLCLVLGSLLGGVVGIVVAGAAGSESGLTVVTSW